MMKYQHSQPFSVDREDMERTPYPIDLADEQWELIEARIPPGEPAPLCRGSGQPDGQDRKEGQRGCDAGKRAKGIFSWIRPV